METMHKTETLKPASHIADDDLITPTKRTVTKKNSLPPEATYRRFDPSVHKSVFDWLKKRDAFLGAYMRTKIIMPDHTPEEKNCEFHQKIFSRLLRPILRKDSAQRFIRLFGTPQGRHMTWGFIIIPEALNRMIVENSLRCAKVALEGHAPELEGFRANPNCMNAYGYFPLHEAAERFSVEMIKLLLHHGASTALRTAGDEVVEDLLPLHVAVEDTCLHKYLEDNLIVPNQEQIPDANYIYKLIHLLCLPDMKIFLDTTSLLAKNTDNLVDEICSYIKDGKIVQTAVLLMAAQAHIRTVGSSHERNGNCTANGFGTITGYIVKHCMDLKLEMAQKNKKKQRHLQAKHDHMLLSLFLVNIIHQAGEALDSYIRMHREVPLAELLEGVSSILKGYGLSPTRESISIENIHPYKWWQTVCGESPEKHGNMVATEVAAETHRKKVTKTELARSERECAWRSFFPYWRSILASKYPHKVYPKYADEDHMKRLNFNQQISNLESNSARKGSILNANKTPPQITQQSRRLFGTAALMFLKMLKRS